jgi:hypothetical protein
MIRRYQKTDSARSPGEMEEDAKSQTGEGSDGTCRCKKTSEMTAGELLKLMMSDLSFWKKTKKE